MYKRDYFCHYVFVAIRRQIPLVCETIYSSLQMVCNAQRTACNQNSVDIIHKLIISKGERGLELALLSVHCITFLAIYAG